MRQKLVLDKKMQFGDDAFGGSVRERIVYDSICDNIKDFISGVLD